MVTLKTWAWRNKNPFGLVLISEEITSGEGNAKRQAYCFISKSVLSLLNIFEINTTQLLGSDVFVLLIQDQC